MAKKKKHHKDSGAGCESTQSLPWKKNDELILEIVDMGSQGEGIGRADGYALFVKDALVGDVIRARIIKTKKQYGYARLMELIQPSPDRVEPACPVARQCGGCQLQHCSYPRQLVWKQEKIAHCLQRIGGLDVRLPGEKLPDASDRAEGTKDHENITAPVVMEPIMGMQEPYYYRNKAQFPVGYDRDGNLVTGFYAGRTHQVIPHTDCLIQHPCNRAILDVVIAFMKEYQIPAYREESHTGLIRHILIRVGKATGQVMVCLVMNGQELPHAKEFVERLLRCESNDHALQDGGIAAVAKQENHLERSCLSTEVERQSRPCKITSICLNVNQEKTNRILGDEIIPLYGQPYIEDSIGDIRYRISPLSFYQVNPEQTKRLYETALEYADLQGGEVVWDLYCGIGTISLFLSQKADKVFGVEIVPQAIENARENARMNHIHNAEFFVGAAEDVIPQKYLESGGSLRADVVVLDPPRKGCDEKLLETVVRMEPERIVYVSCDPATLARDLKYLCSHGCELKRVRGCDMFGMSYHVESVCLLHRTDS